MAFDSETKIGNIPICVYYITNSDKLTYTQKIDQICAYYKTKVQNFGFSDEQITRLIVKWSRCMFPTSKIYKIHRSEYYREKIYRV